MIEIIASIVIVVTSALLFVYWLRFAWSLIWNHKASDPSGWRGYRSPEEPSGRS